MAEMARVKDEPLVYLGHPVAVLPGEGGHHAAAGAAGHEEGASRGKASHHDTPEGVLKTVSYHMRTSWCHLLWVSGL